MRTRSLDITGGGKLDLGQAALAVTYTVQQPTPLASIRSLIVSGFANGAWTGPGIVSSFADASSHAIGYAEFAALGNAPPIFGSVDPSTVLVRYTRYGDADLNGTVNLIDFNRLAVNFNGTNKLWTDGDFNYDGQVNLLDFNKLAVNFNQA